MDLLPIQVELRRYTDQIRADFAPHFFKAGPGEYAEGDQFIGVSVPNCRNVVAQYWRTIPDSELLTMLHSPVHEDRLVGLLILIKRYESAKTDGDKQKVLTTYLDNLSAANNWDLVDSSAGRILGTWLLAHPEDLKILTKLSNSGQLWQERISIIATFAFIRAERYTLTLELCEKFLTHKHDLIHKACGWMLREIGNRDRAILKSFISKHLTEMPRTMLRYAIEKFPESERKAILNRAS